MTRLRLALALGLLRERVLCCAGLVPHGRGLDVLRATVRALGALDRAVWP